MQWLANSCKYKNKNNGFSENNADNDEINENMNVANMLQQRQQFAREQAQVLPYT